MLMKQDVLMAPINTDSSIFQRCGPPVCLAGPRLHALDTQPE